MPSRRLTSPRLSLAATGMILGVVLKSPLRTEASWAGGGGSELPWWSPVAVSLILVLLAALVRRRQRPRDRDTGLPGEQLSLWDAANPTGDDVPPPERPRSGFDRDRVRGVLAPTPISAFPALGSRGQRSPA